MQDRVAKPPDDDLFLPDFCDMGTVFTVVVVGALLAFVLGGAHFVSAHAMFKNRPLLNAISNQLG